MYVMWFRSDPARRTIRVTGPRGIAGVSRGRVFLLKGEVGLSMHGSRVQGCVRC